MKENKKVRKSPMKILTLEPNTLDNMWDDIKEAFHCADAGYNDMLYDVDAGKELSPFKRKSFKADLDNLEMRLRVLRMEADV